MILPHLASFVLPSFIIIAVLLPILIMSFITSHHKFVDNTDQGVLISLENLTVCSMQRYLSQNLTIHRCSQAKVLLMFGAHSAYKPSRENLTPHRIPNPAETVGLYSGRHLPLANLYSKWVRKNFSRSIILILFRELECIILFRRLPDESDYSLTTRLFT